ncbi:MAG: DUF5343 domain-containing protein [Dehalococcoidia bacterium]
MPETSKSVSSTPTLPYGPTKGMLQALQLMRKSTPPRIDGNFLRLNKVAPGNEYKVIGALRFLGVIDDEGKPTEKSRLLKTKGQVFNNALQEIVKEAYRDVFEMMNGNGCTHDDMFNYFVTKHDLGPEMAAKTTRFFLQLCQMAEIDLGIRGKEKQAPVKKSPNGRQKQDKGPFLQVQGPGFPLLLALTPEMAAMDTEELAGFFRKLKTALAKAGEE